MKAYLEIINGHQEGICTVIENKESFTIGSGDGCDLDLAEDVGTRVRIRCVCDEKAGVSANNPGEVLVVESFSGTECFLNSHPLSVGMLIDDGDMLTVQKVKIFIGINRNEADINAVRRGALRR